MVLDVLAGIIIGYSLAYVNNAIPVINAIFGWETDAEKALNDALINAGISLGAGIGASVGGKAIKYGRRKTVLVSSVIGILGCTI